MGDERSNLQSGQDQLISFLSDFRKEVNEEFRIFRKEQNAQGERMAGVAVALEGLKGQELKISAISTDLREFKYDVKVRDEDRERRLIALENKLKAQEEIVANNRKGWTNTFVGLRDKAIQWAGLGAVVYVVSQLLRVIFPGLPELPISPPKP